MMTNNLDAYKALIKNAAQLWDNEEYYKIQKAKNTNYEIDANKVPSQEAFLFNITSLAEEDE